MLLDFEHDTLTVCGKKQFRGGSSCVVYVAQANVRTSVRSAAWSTHGEAVSSDICTRMVAKDASSVARTDSGL